MPLSLIALDIENGIDVAFSTVGDKDNIFVLPYIVDTGATSVYDKVNNFGEPIKIYGLINPNQSSDSSEGKELTNKLSLTVSAKCLRGVNLLDDNNVLTLTDKCQIKYKGDIYNILKVNPDTPYENTFATYVVNCQQLK